MLDQELAHLAGTPGRMAARTVGKEAAATEDKQTHPLPSVAVLTARSAESPAKHLQRATALWAMVRSSLRERLGRITPGKVATAEPC